MLVDLLKLSRAIGDKGQSRALEAIEDGRVITSLQFSKRQRAGANGWKGELIHIPYLGPLYHPFIHAVA